MANAPAFIANLYEDSKKALARFPISVIIAVIGTGVALYFSTFWNDAKDNGGYEILRVLLTLISLFPLSISARLIEEELELTKTIRWVPYLCALVYAVLLFFIIPPNQENAFGSHSSAPFGGVVAMEVAAFLSPITFLFLGKKGPLAFWSFTKGLVMRLLVTGLFSAVLFIGSALVVTSTNFLFNLAISDNVYPRLWIVIVGIMASWFFLSGVPEKKSAEPSYSDLLKKFVTYILVPLVTLYTLVLYIYGLKILFTQNWPQGDTVYLIMGYLISALGTYLIAYPLAQKSKTWNKLFMATIVAWIPILILYFASLYLRIDQYGVTIHRYYVVMFGILFVILTPYLLLSKKRNLVFIPLIATVCIFVSQFGPLRAQNIALYSQITRLEKTLTKEGLLQNGKLVPAQKDATEQLMYKDDAYDQIASGLSYLDYYLTLESIEKWLPEDAKAMYDLTNNSAPKSERILNYLYGPTPETSNLATFTTTTHLYLDVSNAKTNTIDIQGYQYMLRIKNAPTDTPSIMSTWYGKTYSVGLQGGAKIAITDVPNADASAQNLKQVAAIPVAEQAKKITQNRTTDYEGGATKEQMTLDGKTPNFTYRLVITDLYLRHETIGSTTHATIVNIDGYLLIKK